jgi:endoglucanase
MRIIDSQSRSIELAQSRSIELASRLLSVLTRRLNPRLVCPLVALLALAGLGAAHAASFDRGGYHFLSTRLYVNENAGAALITVERTDAQRAGAVGYVTIGRTAVTPYDYTNVKRTLTFAPGQKSATFRVPVVDHGVRGLPLSLSVSLYGPWPDGFGHPRHAILTILSNDSVATVNPDDPLGLPNASIRTNPLAGARFYVNSQSASALAAHRYPLLRVIAAQPAAGRFGSFNRPSATLAVARYLARAAYQEPGAIPILTTYRIVDGHCGHWADPPRDQLSYHNFVEGLAHGIGSYRAVMFLEQDSLITVGCLSRQGVAVRMHELSDAIDILTADCPHLVIYLDAGAADAVPAREIARLLLRAGVQKIQGFFLNSTHFDWTLHEIRFGEQISRMIGGKHFAVSTGENGRGPLVPRDRVRYGNEVLCNPPGRGLGPKPTSNTGFPRVDALVWLGDPGGSGGACVPGAPPGGVYWPQYALMLVRNAEFAVH